MKNEGFTWPNGMRAAVSLTFDDGRESQVMVGIPLLNQHGVKATFYIYPSWAKSRLSEWREAVVAGHHIGNHTIRHPGTVNLSWAKDSALEDYNLDQMANELDTANAVIELMLGVQPLTFSYPCGQTFVGRGKDAKSYIPLVAQRFLAGRGWRNECTNDPSLCDLAHIMGIELDGLNPEQLKELVHRAAEEGSWLVLCGHEVGNSGPRTTYVQTLVAFCEYVSNPKNRIWIAPVIDIASYITSHRQNDHRNRVVRSRRQTFLIISYTSAILLVCIMSFLGYFIVQKGAPASLVSFLTPLLILLLIIVSAWWWLYGFILPKSPLGLLGILGYCLNRWNSKLRHTHHRE